MRQILTVYMLIQIYVQSKQLNVTTVNITVVNLSNSWLLLITQLLSKFL